MCTSMVMFYAHRCCGCPESGFRRWCRGQAGLFSTPALFVEGGHRPTAQRFVCRHGGRFRGGVIGFGVGWEKITWLSRLVTTLKKEFVSNATLV